MKLMFTAFVFVLAFTSTHTPIFAQTSVDGPIVGHSEGNHRLDCTIFRPWDGAETGGPYPVIGWTNGWGQGNVLGADQVLNYDSGLYFWAETGDYIVVAANQWSPRAPDILQCLQWLLDENNDESSEYHGTVRTDQIGVSGHSQGGGAALKAGDEVVYDGIESVEIKTVVAMNPYGPSFVKARGQNGQILLLGGDHDGVTPTDSFSAVLEDSIVSGDRGGVQAELTGGTHCYPACDITGGNFGVFGAVSLLWFDMYLKGVDNCDALVQEFATSKWDMDNTFLSSNFCSP